MYLLIYKPKVNRSHKYKTADGTIGVQPEIEDMSELLRGKVMVLDDILQLQLVLEKQGQEELERLARENSKKESSDAV